jgi:DNA invertase Pin-like site-specific DNA recombinase
MRCAIYTRKSTEEGLRQEFTSLDAQRDSAEAYILSQREAGWSALPERYDDGGFTGANLERPALRRLLTDIEAGGIQCILVYKIDRLSRSLLDFARLMGEFEKHGISLVSVTQQFNTTGSLGRLTLNIVLSLAEFERDLICERTADKMAAARRRGKWVGGIPVLGYDVAGGGGKLLVNEEEARRVRAIFGAFLQHRDLFAVLDLIERRAWTTKTWTTRAGRLRTGRPFRKKELLALLSNAVYTGKVVYQGQSYPGEHTAIVEEGVWQRTQSLLQKKQTSINRVQRRTSCPRKETNVRSLPEAAPRITRLLALALKFEGLIHQGAVRDYADLARLGQVSRARVTQIMNLLNLAPEIQEEILSWGVGGSGDRDIPETSIRTLSAEVIWSRQREQWKNWAPAV